MHTRISLHYGNFISPLPFRQKIRDSAVSLIAKMRWGVGPNERFLGSQGRGFQFFTGCLSQEGEGRLEGEQILTFFKPNPRE